MAESCTICSSRSRRSLRKLLDTPSYVLPLNYDTTFHTRTKQLVTVLYIHTAIVSEIRRNNNRFGLHINISHHVVNYLPNSMQESLLTSWLNISWSTHCLLSNPKFITKTLCLRFVSTLSGLTAINKLPSSSSKNKKSQERQKSVREFINFCS
jgi:hypothetical protein